MKNLNITYSIINFTNIRLKRLGKSPYPANKTPCYIFIPLLKL